MVSDYKFHVSPKHLKKEKWEHNKRLKQGRMLEVCMSCDRFVDAEPWSSQAKEEEDIAGSLGLSGCSFCQGETSVWIF